MKAVIVIQVAIFLMWSSWSNAQDGSLDPAFGGGDGQVSTSFFTDKPCQAYSVAVHTNGRIVVSGITRGAGDTEHSALACYSPDGSPDQGFNGNGKMIVSVEGANALSQAVAVQPDGKIILVVRAEYGTESKIHLYRYNPDGSPDISFGGNGMVTTDVDAKYMSGRAVTLQPDGKILVGGYMGYDEPLDKFYVARYLPDGTPDAQFDGDGLVITQVGESYTAIGSLIVQPDGKIIAAGYAVFDQHDAFAVVRYHHNGALDQSFSGDGIANATFEDGDDRANGAVLQPDGKIVLGGYAYSSVTGGNDFAAARFNADGTLDSSFHGDGMATVQVTAYADQAGSILLQPDGKIVLAGYAHSNDPNLRSEMAMVRLNENGIPDFTFDGDGIAIYEDPNTTGEIHTMALQPDGKIVGAGFIRTDGLNAIRVARVLTGLTVSTDDDRFSLATCTLYPNPASDQVWLDYELERNETITIQLYDVQGRLMQHLLPASHRQSGAHSEKLLIDRGLPAGHYLVTIMSKSRRTSVPLIVD